MRNRMLFYPAALAAVVALTACGGTTAATDTNGGESTDISDSNEVASLSDSDQADDQADPGSTLNTDEAALEFSACLRDEGLDVPDIGVDADGNIELRDAFSSIDRSDDSFRSAMEACSEILADAGFGGGGGPGAAIRDSVEIQDALVEVVDCMREQGYSEATDITLGGPGGGQGDGGEPGEPSDGQRQGQGQGQGPGQGGRNDRLVTQMGLDADDPAVLEAIEVCAPIIDEAFAASGIGQPGDNR